MDKSTCFNVTLDSDDCRNIFSENKISNFRVRLPRNIHLNDSWRVGLADVTFNNSRFNFDEVVRVEVWSPDHSDFSAYVFIKPAVYEDIPKLVQEINEQIGLSLAFEHNPKVLFKDGRIRIQPGWYKGLDGDNKRLELKFGPDLTQILGLERWGIPFINARQPILFIYCSVVKQRVVGDVSAKLLRTIDPSKGKTFGSTVSQVFRRIYFCDIDTHDFNEIEIQLLDDTGREPKFKYGTFRATLQFKQSL